MMRYKFIREEFQRFANEAFDFLNDEVSIWYLRGTARDPYFEKISPEYVLNNKFDRTAIGVVSATLDDAPLPWEMLTEEKKDNFVQQVKEKIPPANNMDLPQGVFKEFYEELCHDKEAFEEVGREFIFKVASMVIRTTNNQSLYLIMNKRESMEILLEDTMQYPQNKVDTAITKWMSSL